MRVMVSPSVDGTTSAMTPIPQTNHEPIITIVRTAVDLPSMASPIDHAPARPTTSQAMRGPQVPVNAETS